MSYQILVGPNAEDVVQYVRDQIEDYTAASFTIPDTTFQNTVSRIVRDVSRFHPMSALVGNVGTATSPLVTVGAQQRYLCNSGNGFSGEIARITDVLYRATGGFNAASEIGYLALLPFSPANTFLFTPSLVDQPSRRILRNEYLNELDHYGIGKAGIGLDPSGNYFVDLFPVPVQSGLPIYVRYDTNHAIQTVGGNSSIPTIPPVAIKPFQSLLLAEIVRIIAIRSSQQIDAKAGLTEVKANPESLRALSRELQEDAYLEMGIAAGAGDTTS